MARNAPYTVSYHEDPRHEQYVHPFLAAGRLSIQHLSKEINAYFIALSVNRLSLLPFISNQIFPLNLAPFLPSDRLFHVTFATEPALCVKVKKLPPLKAILASSFIHSSIYHIDAYLEQYDLVATYNCRSELEKATLLASRLIGAARQTIPIGYSIQFLTHEQLCKRLRKSTGSMRQPSCHITALSAITQKPQETVKDLVDQFTSNI